MANTFLCKSSGKTQPPRVLHTATALPATAGGASAAPEASPSVDAAWDAYVSTLGQPMEGTDDHTRVLTIVLHSDTSLRGQLQNRFYVDTCAQDTIITFDILRDHFVSLEGGPSPVGTITDMAPVLDITKPHITGSGTCIIDIPLPHHQVPLTVPLAGAKFMAGLPSSLAINILSWARALDIGFDDGVFKKAPGATSSMSFTDSDARTYTIPLTYDSVMRMWYFDIAPASGCSPVAPTSASCVSRCLTTASPGTVSAPAQSTSPGEGLPEVVPPGIDISISPPTSTGTSVPRQHVALMPTVPIPAAEQRLLQLHRRLGHASETIMKLLYDKGVFPAFTWPKGVHLPECAACILGKFTRMALSRTSPGRSTTPTYRGELVYTDLAGPISPPGVHQARFLAVFADSFSGHQECFAIRTKGDYPSALRQFLVVFGAMHELRGDRAKEFISTEVETIISQHGTGSLLSHSSVHTPQQNAVAESTVFRLFTRGRCMLIDSGMPLELWPYALTYAARVHNVVPNKEGNIPLTFDNRAHHQSGLHYDRFHPFGTIAYVDVSRSVHVGDSTAKGQKLHPKALVGIFIGLSRNSPDMHVWLPSEGRGQLTGGRVIQSRSVLVSEFYIHSVPPGLLPPLGTPLVRFAQLPGYSTASPQPVITISGTMGHPAQRTSSPPPPSLQDLASASPQAAAAQEPPALALPPPRAAEPPREERLVIPAASPPGGLPPTSSVLPVQPPSRAVGGAAEPTESPPLSDDGGGASAMEQPPPRDVGRGAAIKDLASRATGPASKVETPPPTRRSQRIAGSSSVHIGKGQSYTLTTIAAASMVPLQPANVGSTYYDHQLLLPTDSGQGAYYDPAVLALLDPDQYLPPIGGFDLPSVAVFHTVLATGRDRALDTVTDLTAPKSLAAALCRPDAALWQAAYDAELHAFHKHPVYVWVPASQTSGRRVLRFTVQYKYKFFSDGTIERRKVRACVRGDMQLFGDTFDVTYAPVVNYTTLRVLVAISAALNWPLRSLDVSEAFLYGELDEGHVIYCYPPEGVKCPLDTTGRPMLWRLTRSVYGLKQGPRSWFHHFRDFLTASAGMTASDTDPCLFLLHDSHGRLILAIALFVDDCLTSIIGAPQAYDRFLVLMKARFQFRTPFDDAPPDTFIGIQLRYTSQYIELHLSAFVKDLLATYLPVGSHPAATPLAYNAIFTLEDSPTTSEEQAEMKSYPYKQVVGALMYLAVTVRPDIAYAVGRATCVMSNPGKIHWQHVVRTMRYLLGAPTLGLRYTRGPLTSTPTAPASSPSSGGSETIRLFGFADADYGRERDFRRNTTGTVLMINDTAVAWASRRQHLTATSSMESEYMAAAECAKDVLFVRNLLRSLGFIINSPTIIYEDNEAAQHLIENQQLNKRSRHIDLRFHFIRHQVFAGHLAIVHIDTKRQLADIFTKAGIATESLEEFRGIIMGHSRVGDWGPSF